MKVKSSSLLKDLRRRFHISQAELARRAGLHQSHIAQIESGRVDVQLGTLRKILDVLECDLKLISKPRRKFHEIIRERARAVARWKVSRLMGTMALEAQRPDERIYRKLLKAEEARLLKGPSSEIWQLPG
jgi:transcriptional regulator with XRE-family HTH domain